MNRGLAQLAFRRALAPAVIAAWILLVVLALTRDWIGANAVLQVEDPAALGRGMLREGVWTVLAIAFLPLLVFRAARAVSIWRAGEREWLDSRGVGRGAIIVSTWIGTWAGGAALIALSCLAVELRAGSAGPSSRRGSDLALPANPRIDARGPLAWTIQDPGKSAPTGSRAGLELGFVSGAGSASEAVFRAKRGGAERASRTHISSRGSIEVEIPPRNGEVAFELACSSPGATAVVLSDAVEIWVPCATDRAASFEIAIRILLALAAWSALALGLGAWVSPSIASFALLAAWIPAWFLDVAPSWLPGADLWTALSVAGMGRVPAAIDPRAFAVGAAIVLAGLVLASRRASA